MVPRATHGEAMDARLSVSLPSTFCFILFKLDRQLIKCYRVCLPNAKQHNRLHSLRQRNVLAIAMRACRRLKKQFPTTTTPHMKQRGYALESSAYGKPNLSPAEAIWVCSYIIKSVGKTSKNRLYSLSDYSDNDILASGRKMEEY